MPNAPSSVSFANTPQAVADAYSIAEDAALGGGTWIFDVMANDAGGNAKSLYSIDDGSARNDLLTKDNANIAEVSRLGASISITSAGKVAYSTSSLGTAVLQQINALNVGESLSDSFTYAIRLGNGTLSWNTVTVTFTGENDRPVITSLPQTGDVVEETTLAATGQVTSSDVDHGATATYSGDADGSYGSFAVNSATGVWTYDLDNDLASVQQLAAGETRQEVFTVTVTVTDDNGATASQAVTITITGTNDAPVAVASTASVLEDAATSGNLSATDVDSDASTTFSIDGTAPAGFTLVNAATGEWTFDASSYDSLTAGQILPLTVNFTATDSHGDHTSSTLSLTVTGVNDNASIVDDGAAAQDFAVTEAGGSNPGDASASGKLLISDADSGEAVFQAATTEGLHGTYGDFTFDEATGAWTYSLRNDDANVDALAAGQNVTDTLHVVSADGTASHDIVVNIAGAGDVVDVVGTNVLTFDGGFYTPLNPVDGFDFTSSGSFYWMAGYSEQVDWYTINGETYNGFAGKTSDMFRTDGSDFSIDGLDISDFGGTHTVEFIGLNNGVEVYHKSVDLTYDSQHVDLDFAGIDDLRIVVTDAAYSGQGVTDTGWWLIDNISFTTI